MFAETEVCPYCDEVNEYLYYSAEVTGNYIKRCKHCGKLIFLCDACIRSEDNPDQRCDWKKKEGGHGCFRGWIKNTPED